MLGVYAQFLPEIYLLLWTFGFYLAIPFPPPPLPRPPGLCLFGGFWLSPAEDVHSNTPWTYPSFLKFFSLFGV